MEVSFPVVCMYCTVLYRVEVSRTGTYSSISFSTRPSLTDQEHCERVVPECRRSVHGLILLIRRGGLGSFTRAKLLTCASGTSLYKTSLISVVLNPLVVCAGLKRQRSQFLLGVETCFCCCECPSSFQIPRIKPAFSRILRCFPLPIGKQRRLPRQHDVG